MRLKWTIILAVLFLAANAGPVMAMGLGQEPAPAEVPAAVLLLIPVLAGGAGVRVVNLLKELLNWTQPEDAKKNTWLAFGVCGALAVMALLLTNQALPTDPQTLAAWIGVAFSTATLIYKQMQVAK
jgi:hypothetical protein